ncbi:MFS transporter [Sphingomonas bacterium]|uniref:MFS transporter n=1 Tax=Sphingomonas bacterium TaxID=1895847 RepID=UPI0015769D34|nr:MFS transporter [Sphingomonas bacterium]
MTDTVLKRQEDSFVVHAAAEPPIGQTDHDVAASTVRAISWRFMPLLTGCFIAAYIDRVNVSFAALTANRDLGLSASQFGWGAGLFFVGYFLAETPSNFIMTKIGARRWFSRIMVSMGVVAGATAFVTSPYEFYGARFLLGCCEAGLLPGVILFLRGWVPKALRAQFMGTFLLAIPLSSVIGAPISGALLELDGLFGLKDWQIMFVLEALPCVILGGLVLLFLTETPDEASWLSLEQKAWLRGRFLEEKKEAEGSLHREANRSWMILLDARVLAFGFAFFGALCGSYGITLWLPQIVKAFGVTSAMNGFVTAIPFVFGSFATIIIARRSDRTRERVWHVAGPALVAAAGLALASIVASPFLMMTAVSLAAIGLFGLRGTFFALVSERFSEDNAPLGIAAIGAYSSLAGLIGPWVVGLLKDATGSFVPGMMFLAVMSLASAATLLLNRRLGVSSIPVRIAEPAG